MTATMTNLVDWILDEQEHLWSDLEREIRVAYNGQWSMGASNAACRIISAARLVGSAPYGAVSWALLAGGVYEAVLRAGGLIPELPDEARWRYLEKLMVDYGDRASLRERYAGTIAAIESPREMALLGNP